MFPLKVMTSSQLVLTALLISTTVLHQCGGNHGCEPKKIKEIKHSLRQPASAYTNAVQKEFRITKVFTKQFKKIPNFKTVAAEYVEPGFSFWKKVMKPKVPTVGTLKLSRSCITSWFYWVKENGVDQKYCPDQCLPEAKCIDYAVPQEYMEDCRVKSNDVDRIIRDGGAGVNDTDFLVFVDYSLTGCNGNKLAFAGSCQQNAETDRPEIAYVNYCPDTIKFTPEVKDKLKKTTIHELGHALGFISSLYAYMRNGKGKPRTRRAKSGNTPDLGRIDDIYRPDTNTLDTRQKLWLTTHGQQYKTVYILKTKNLVAAARKHFRCGDLTGVDLENNENGAAIGSHFEQSILNDDVMAPTVGNSHVSELTLAFMKDTGWYDVDMSAAEAMSWGYKKGCRFATWNCAAYMSYQQANNKSMKPWCMQVQHYCQSDGTYCDLRKMTKPVPDDWAYFSSIENVPANETNRYAGTDKYMDYCPSTMPC